MMRCNCLLPVLMILALPAMAVAQDAPPINLRRTVTVEVVEKTKGAVVNISAKKMVNERVVNPFFQQFDMGQVVRVPADSLGSGFIIQRDGYVVTNNHVVDRARQISVELSDGRKLPADLISTDADADLAILRIHSDSPLPTLELGDSSDLMIGEPVIAVGNPLGYSHSVSTGIVSALHRDIDAERQDQSNAPLKGEDAALRDLIQTDAAINPGNSGGPLLNAYGQVIGMNTAIRGDAQNIGFAIPIDRLRDLIPELMNSAQATKVDVPLKLKEKRTLSEPATVTAEVVSVGPDSRVLRSIDGEHPQNIVDAYAMLLRSKVGQPVNIVWADGEKLRIMPQAAPIPDAILQAKGRLGLTVEQITPILADQMHLTEEDGLLITRVDNDSIAARAGIEPGDIIFRLGRYPIKSLDDFGALMPYLPASGRVYIGIVRDNQSGLVPLEF